MKNFRDKKPGWSGGSSKPSFENKSWGVDRGQSYGSSRDKQLFKATCSECGKSCEVPFRPTGEKPVFCSDCFNKKREATDTRGDTRGENRGEKPQYDRAPKRDFNDRYAPHKPVFQNDETKKQLSDISFKLDKLIGLMEIMNTPKNEIKREIIVKAPSKKVVAKKKVVVKKKK